MANSPAGGEVSHSGPENVDPFAPLSLQIQQFEAMLELVFEDYQSFVKDLSEEILSLPPKERFTKSPEVLREHIETRFGSTDAFTALLPEANIERFHEKLGEIVEKQLEQILPGIFYERTPDDRLVLAALFKTFHTAIDRIQDVEDEETEKRLIGSILVLACHLQGLGEGEESLDEEMVRDVGYAIAHVFSTSDNHSPVPDPDELDTDEARQLVREVGAVVAYTRLNISVSRGGELAGVTTEEFSKVLQSFGIQPRHGPITIDELHEDSVLNG